MDLVSVDPEFNLYNRKWPIWTSQAQLPGAKFTLRGTAEDSIVGSGCIISGGDVDRSVAVAERDGRQVGQRSRSR